MNDKLKKKLKDIIINTVLNGEKLDIKPNIKPGHGSCCTCQTCGYYHDECNCDIRETVKALDLAVDQIILVLQERGENETV